MIEWNLFYKMLDIPEKLTEPTFYDLLGLQAETCGAERVDRMLHRQKKRLRKLLLSRPAVYAGCTEAVFICLRSDISMLKSLPHHHTLP